MKKVAYGVMIVFLVMGLFALDSIDLLSKEAQAEASAQESNLVTVNGSATVKVKPDIAFINVGVESFSDDAQKAQTENKDIMDKVISEIKGLGIKEEDMKTINYNIYKTVKGYEKDNRTEGYNVRNVVEVTIRDTNKVGKVIDKASKSGANNIGNIRFGITDEESYYNEALKIAMGNASNKAEAILSTFDANIGKPYSVEENGFSSPVIYRDSIKYKSVMEDQAQTPVEEGELEITARVVVKYKY